LLRTLSTLAERFRAQVLQHSDRLALSAGDGALSYAELDRAAKGVTNALLEQANLGAQRVVLLQ
jgi:non-ribosomal peptide synthetase component E (peptide arylation enzyme)